MNIEELRKALASEATERSKAQELELKKLRRQVTNMRAQITNLSDEIKEYQHILQAQFNRCYVLTGFGAMCYMCGHSITCRALRTTRRPEKEDNK